MPAAYPEEFRRRAVDLVRESEESVSAVARRLGTSSSGLRRWVAQAEIDEGQVPGLTTDQLEELKTLRRENRELRRANEILRKASAYFAQAELDRLPRR